MTIRRAQLVAPAVVLLLTIGAIAGVWGLVGRTYASHHSELQISSMMRSVADLQSAPFNAERAAGGSATLVQSRITADEHTISQGLTTRSQPGISSALLVAGRSELATIRPVVEQIYRLAVQPGGLSATRPKLRVPRLQMALTVRSHALSKLLSDVSQRDAARAALARTQIKFGSAGAMLLLVLAFAFFYFRSVAARVVVERLVAQNEALLEVSRAEAKTDALTGLGNRRALTQDFADAIAQTSEAVELLLVIFDLDRFKQYNDRFGHAAGDVLLKRLGVQLAAACAPRSCVAYRLGGDEFCVLARCCPEEAERLLVETGAALHGSGDGWRIGCSKGAAWVPHEAATETQALKLADSRMYAEKESRSPAGRPAIGAGDTQTAVSTTEASWSAPVQ